MLIGTPPKFTEGIKNGLLEVIKTGTYSDLVKLFDELEYVSTNVEEAGYSQRRKKRLKECISKIERQLTARR